jgi:hypothetical protein
MWIRRAQRYSFLCNIGQKYQKDSYIVHEFQKIHAKMNYHKREMDKMQALLVN